MMNVIFWVVFCSFIAMSVMLTLLVLVQKGRGGGLTSAISGANTFIGSQAPRVITWSTAAMFGLFVLLAITLNLLT